MAKRPEGGTGDEILINATPRETRVAVVENGVLQEILIERAGRRGLVGNIYKGRVCRVLPGMEAAFDGYLRTLICIEKGEFYTRHTRPVTFCPVFDTHRSIPRDRNAYVPVAILEFP